MAWTEAFPMSFPLTFQSGADTEARAEKALRWPVGAASPLWFLFGAAASAGVAWWWMTRWTRAENVEALAGVVASRVKASVEAAADSELRVEEAVVAASHAVAEAEPAVVEAEPIVAEAAEAVAAEVAAKPVAVEALEADDLTQMTGIGPKLSLALAERGVTRFAQIAAWTADDLAAFDAALSLKGRAVREAWVAQAKRLAKG